MKYLDAGVETKRLKMCKKLVKIAQAMMELEPPIPPLKLKQKSVGFEMPTAKVVERSTHTKSEPKSQKDLQSKTVAQETNNLEIQLDDQVVTNTTDDAKLRSHFMTPILEIEEPWPNEFWEAIRSAKDGSATFQSAPIIEVNTGHDVYQEKIQSLNGDAGSIESKPESLKTLPSYIIEHEKKSKTRVVPSQRKAVPKMMDTKNSNRVLCALPRVDSLDDHHPQCLGTPGCRGVDVSPSLLFSNSNGPLACGSLGLSSSDPFGLFSLSISVLSSSLEVCFFVELVALEDVAIVVVLTGRETSLAFWMRATCELAIGRSSIMPKACVDETQMIWYFDSGASKHISSRKDMFCSLDPTLAGKKVTCENNASYPIKGVGILENGLFVLDRYDKQIQEIKKKLQGQPEKGPVEENAKKDVQKEKLEVEDHPPSPMDTTQLLHQHELPEKIRDNEPEMDKKAKDKYNFEDQIAIGYSIKDAMEAVYNMTIPPWVVKEKVKEAMKEYKQGIESQPQEPTKEKEKEGEPKIEVKMAPLNQKDQEGSKQQPEHLRKAHGVT
ncbi:hypothetical protein L7F22_022712 [Adiantum nelumboides]|nr:hypothetical protein [Adiantum nelumboides]